MGIQSFGESYCRDRLIEARHKAHRLAVELASLIRPGMIEEEAHTLYNELSAQHGVEKQWHPPKLRFGPNTIKNFREHSDPYVLKEQDIFFVDIGPVWNGHEADYGETFVLGDLLYLQKLAKAATTLFNDVSYYWKTTQVRGVELYEYAQTKAQLLGYELSHNSRGHRIGDFPHHVHFRGKLEECLDVLIPDAWILEIHLIDRERMLGAFFEDLLAQNLRY